MTESELHQVSTAIGQVQGELKGIRETVEARLDGIHDLMVSHQSTADKEWNDIKSEIRNVKHDYRNVEQKVDQLGYAQKRSDEKALELSDALTGDGGMEHRLGKLERLAERAAVIYGLLLAAGTVLAFILAHYGAELARWIFGPRGP